MGLDWDAVMDSKAIGNYEYHLVFTGDGYAIDMTKIGEGLRQSPMRMYHGYLDDCIEWVDNREKEYRVNLFEY